MVIAGASKDHYSLCYTVSQMLRRHAEPLSFMYPPPGYPCKPSDKCVPPIYQKHHAKMEMQLLAVMDIDHAFGLLTQHLRIDEKRYCLGYLKPSKNYQALDLP